MVTIKDMEMPRSCFSCPFSKRGSALDGGYYCRLQLIGEMKIFAKSQYRINGEFKDKQGCPLINIEQSEDCVSRQAVKEGMIKYGFHAPDMTVTEFIEDELLLATPKISTSDDCVSRADLLAQINESWETIETKIDFVNIVNALPPVTLTQKWIPVSERLPENFQRVLVTVVNYAGDKVVRVAEYHNQKRMFQIKENHEQWEVGEKGLLAWQPFSKPYEDKRGSGNE